MNTLDLANKVFGEYLQEQRKTIKAYLKNKMFDQANEEFLGLMGAYEMCFYIDKKFDIQLIIHNALMEEFSMFI